MKCGGASQLILEDKGIYDFYGIFQYCCFNIWLWNLNSNIWMPTCLSFSLLQLIPTASPGVFHAYLGMNRHALLLWKCSKGAGELENACCAIMRPWVWFPGHMYKASCAGGIWQSSTGSDMTPWGSPNSLLVNLASSGERPGLSKLSGWHIRRNDT